jgi:hypothetical protein
MIFAVIFHGSAWRFFTVLGGSAFVMGSWFCRFFIVFLDFFRGVLKHAEISRHVAPGSTISD